MQVYIFRILAEEKEAFLREIALSENNTLLDFHIIFTKSICFNYKQLASFYLTDKQWEKQREFTLMDMDIDNYTGDRQGEGMVPIDVMSNVRIGDIMKDPRQRMLYEYNFVNPVLFFISLINIREEDVKGEVFPKIMQSEGNINIEQIAMFDNDMDDDLTEDSYAEDDFHDFGFESEDHFYNDEHYEESDSFGNEDY